MARGRKKQEVPEIDESKISRLTFRLDEDTVATFKTIAAIKRQKLEELGKEAIDDLIKKHQSTMQNFRKLFE